MNLRQFKTLFEISFLSQAINGIFPHREISGGKLEVTDCSSFPSIILFL